MILLICKFITLFIGIYFTPLLIAKISYEQAVTWIEFSLFSLSITSFITLQWLL